MKISSAKPATASVSQPPSAILRLLASTKVRSITANSSTATATAQRFQRHSRQATMPASSVVVTMVIDTAIP